MNFDQAYNTFTNYLNEHHYGEFDSDVLEKTVQDLLDKLGADEDSKDLYKSLEAWIKDTYPNHVSTETEAE